MGRQSQYSFGVKIIVSTNYSSGQRHTPQQRNVCVLTCVLFLSEFWLCYFQLVDLQIFAAPRITLKPLVPTFPCFANIVVSLLEKVSGTFWTLEYFFIFFVFDFYFIFNPKVNEWILIRIFPVWWFFPDYVQPHVDFGMKILGGDIMSIPGLYRFVQVLH